jgi:hypothetical protein
VVKSFVAIALAFIYFFRKKWDILNPVERAELAFIAIPL